MKKALIFTLAIVSIFAFALNAIAASSCENCSSKKVCSEAKAGGSCGDSPAGAVKNISVDKKETAGIETTKADFTSLAATVRGGAKNSVIKVKGEKALLDKLSNNFAARFGLKDKKSADCELVNIAAELWIKINAGNEKEKTEYLESLGIKIEKK